MVLDRADRADRADPADRADSDDLARLVAASPGHLVLPTGTRRASVEVATPLRLAAALRLDAVRWLAVVIDAQGGRWTVPLHRDGEQLHRANAGDGVAQALVRLLAHGPRQAGAFDLQVWAAELVHGERAITVDQTNESVIVGERAVVKWSVRLPAADDLAGHPAARRIATLAAQRFEGVPRPWALVHWRDADAAASGGAATALLASIDEYLPGAEDGWNWAVEDVRSFARGQREAAGAVEPAAELGTLTARMHVALATAGRDTATSLDTRRWAAAARADLDEAMRLLDGEEGERLRNRAARITTTFAKLTECDDTTLIDVHGDLHVGQVLRRGHPPTYAIIDFDGNPIVTPEERVRRQPAALDVAGMLASLDHVSRVVLKRTDGVDAALVAQWRGAAQTAFLDAYRSSLASRGSADLLDERLLLPLRLQQECREFIYAVRHLPLWRYVPDAALLDLLPDTALPDTALPDTALPDQE